ncbi:hypothetical protein [Dinghuibacter silviterrae]|uniref:Cro/C1-type helix-turn-helix DNA-binding protein n=1 Tax=Dinghuibacter silviterrae TaxID=1539049 RepID=A0A4R8DRK4_9BACT|nr:hypothetical protein [Dinghuibacter silviterrae]TDX00466.1 hypothetical protein EDB95_1491 [Dinghuibacter silviterrae]
MATETHLAAARALLEQNKIKNISELFVFLNKTETRKELRIGFQTLSNKIEFPERFTVGELMTLAKIIEVDYSVISNLAYISVKE